MSLLPYMIREMMRPMRMMEQHVRMFPEEFFKPVNSIFHVPFWERSLEQHESGDSSITSDKEKLQIKLDVKNFSPEELSVKTKEDNSIVVEGKHEEKQDNHGYISRHFVRRFVLPQGHEIKSIVSTLSQDGILTIVAPRKPEAELKERSIPIEHIGKEEPKIENKNEN